MKKTILIFSTMFLSIPLWALNLNSTPVRGAIIAANRSDDVIVIDAGHGGKDSGAVYGDIKEKDITLAIAKKLAKALGDNVILTRDGDYYVSLRERCDIANRADASLFISIHVNSSKEPPKTAGAEVWFFESSKKGGEIARKVAKAIGAKRGVKAGRFYVLKHTKCPAILIEVGFINDEDDLKKITSPEWQDKFVKVVAKLIREVR